MEEMRGITVKVPAALHAKSTEERDAQDPPMTMSQYITAILEEHFNNKMEGGKTMNSNNRTLAFQVPEELFYRVKTYLTAHTTNGRKLSQRDFVVGLIEQELDRWEAEQQADGAGSPEGRIDDQDTSDTHEGDEEQGTNEGNEA
ncbi:translation initiation factor 2 [Pseudoflavonifractor phocaeensis]|uniref:translation initiation factor 2 n=1 Tax=Pseudoflavonifractor phocaeensis TaxID=1870988 RepID=UPI00210A749F|nr:translation initiation factor 2 [Pseudoflavonifractor phocaeensis]MCQ4862686.1 translation initiation factor 2 [Pseudoflavonifractor phocaeensis]